ncbi:MAG: DHHA1 domain-containing protein [Phycisphaerae bacterium]|nr:DHHA1 domain-containing protein [Phycisphaerae bacterium]
MNVADAKVTQVFYHDDPDGQWAAYAAYRGYRRDADYTPWRAGVPLPPISKGQAVVVLDLGQSFAEVTRLGAEAAAVLVIDHHASCALDYAGPRPENVQVVYDPTHAACVLAWSFLRPAEPLPELLAYVEDRDLWKFELPDSHEINAALASYDFALDTAEHLLGSLESLRSEGRAIWRAYQRQIGLLALQAWAGVFQTETPASDGLCGTPDADPEAYDVIVACASHFQASDLAHRMLDQNPGAEFAVVAVIHADEVTFELRSRRNEFDVGALAKRHGGGGHATAASFRYGLTHGLLFLNEIICPLDKKPEELTAPGAAPALTVAPDAVPVQNSLGDAPKECDAGAAPAAPDVAVELPVTTAPDAGAARTAAPAEGATPKEAARGGAKKSKWR